MIKLRNHYKRSQATYLHQQLQIKESIFLKHPTIRAAMARVEVENPKIKEARGIPWNPSPLKAARTMKTGEIQETVWERSQSDLQL